MNIDDSFHIYCRYAQAHLLKVALKYQCVFHFDFPFSNYQLSREQWRTGDGAPWAESLLSPRRPSPDHMPIFRLKFGWINDSPPPPPPPDSWALYHCS